MATRVSRNVGEQLLELEQAGIEAARGRRSAAVGPGRRRPGARRLALELARGPHRLLDVADREPLGHRPAGEVLLEGAVGRAEQRLGVAGAELAVGDELLDAGGSWNSRRVFDDRRPALADPGGDLLVGEAELLDELLVGGRLLERVEVRAVEVLDEGLLERGGVVEHLDEGRDRGRARPGGPPASAARRR